MAGLRSKIVALSLLLPSVIALGAVQAEESFSPFVAADGTISLPEDFRSWAHLGTWSVDSDEEEGGSAGYHQVYTQPETIEAYRRTGRFPDGAVLVKELLSTATADMTTGRISRAAKTDGWFVMIKDGEGRFAGNPLWGDGWGWALFESDKPNATVTTDYRADCLGCHVPAQANDWVYVEGYPVLRD